MPINKTNKLIRIACALITILLLLTGCSLQDSGLGKSSFTIREDGTLVSPSGEEYVCIGREPLLTNVGELVFESRVRGEKKYSNRGFGIRYQNGLFAVGTGGNDSILIRREPESEWRSFYRKASLPEFDFSADGCSRIELVKETWPDDNTAGAHRDCGGGISDKDRISEFLADIRSQKDPKAAGVYELCRRADGLLENCYAYGYIYGFFESESGLAYVMPVTSYNDLAYSVWIGNAWFVLPEAWMKVLTDSMCDID